MRKKFEEQMKFTYMIPENKLGKELESISQILDGNLSVLDAVYKDLTKYTNTSTGRKGLNANQVLRSVIIKQFWSMTYDELEFHLSDSTTFRAFARIENNQYPKKSALQSNIKAISAETWEKINRALVDYSLKKEIEQGNMTRTDATAVDTDIHYPTDSTLLQDGIRVITRTLARGKMLDPIPEYNFSDHNRGAKKKVLTIDNAKKKKRDKAYKELLRLANNVVGYAEKAIRVLLSYESPDYESSMFAQMYANQLEYNLEILKQVIDQTTRRIIHGEKVPAQEKVLSFFECHTDIIEKGNRETQFGHKVFMTTGSSGVILDCLMPRGNPNDSAMFEELLDRQNEILGKSPRQMAADGGFASKDNLEKAKESGIEDMAFGKKRGLKILDMAKSEWVYKKLRNFRAGVEGLISALKRAFGLDRCTWKDWEGFKQYVWSCIVTFNLQVMARA